MTKSTLNLTLYSVQAIVFLDSDGKRILAKYYDHAAFPSVKEQKALEKTLFEKSKKASSNEILMADNHVAVYRNNMDVFLYVVGPMMENELLLAGVLTGLYETIHSLLKGHVEKRSILDHLDWILLAVDETVDQGIVLETDAPSICQRVQRRGGADGVGGLDLSFSEQSISQALQNAREQLARSLLK